MQPKHASLIALCLLVVGLAYSGGCATSPHHQFEPAILDGRVTFILEPVGIDHDITIDLYIMNSTSERIDNILLGPHLDSCVRLSSVNPIAESKMHEPCFTVIHDGNRAEYTGPLIYSSYSTRLSGLTLGPFEKAKVGRFRVGAFYNLKEPGLYQISYPGNSGSSPRSRQPASNIVYFRNPG